VSGVRREADNQRAKLRQASDAMDAETKRRAARGKPDLATAVANAFALLSPEGKVHVAMMAAQRLRIQPPFAPK
jgi:hypothetical protein